MVKVLRQYRPTGLPHKAQSTIRADDPRYDRKQAAAYLGLRPQTLAVWACTGRYKLPFYKVGNKSIYLKSALDRFFQSRARGRE